jgi:hypothetical protein
MRKFLIVTLLSTLLTSCAIGCFPWDNRVSIEDVRDSVYQVKVELTLDLTPYHAYLKKKGGESVLHRILGGPRLPLTERHTTLMAQMEVQSDTSIVSWVGTGWVAAKSDGQTFLMTAGHVCESRDSYAVEFLDVDPDGIGVVTIDLPIINRNHTLVSRNGVEYQRATVIRDDDFEDGFDGPDLCMLGANGDLGKVLPVAEKDPKYAAHGEVVGGPRGLWGGGIAVASDVKFSGRGSIFGVKPDGLAFNGLVAPGNSGSAVVFDGRVVGVISLGATRFPSLVHAIPHEIIREFIRKALHRED